MTNAFEEQNRMRKVDAMRTWLDATLVQQHIDPLHPEVATWVAETLTRAGKIPAVRSAFARVAHLKSEPSDDTWAEFVAQYESRR